MWFAALLVLLTSLVGCAQYDDMRSANLAASARDRVASDDAACRPSGAPGSPGYDDCRKRLANQQASESQSHQRLVDQMMKEGAREAHPWKHWAEWQDDRHAADRRMPGATSRWNRGKDLSWEPLRIERVCEVGYDHLQGTRFRHATHFKRWRPDKPPAECRYDQLDVTPAIEIERLFGHRE